MAQCPVCQAEFAADNTEICTVCGWDLTPYPPTYGQIPAVLLQKRQAQLTWAQLQWKRLQTQQQQSSLGTTSSSKLDRLEARLLAIDDQLRMAQTERANLQYQVSQTLVQCERIEQSLNEQTGDQHQGETIPPPDLEKPEVVVLELESFEEMPKILHALAAGKSVVLNIKGMSSEAAQRSVDFVSGFIHGVHGYQEQLEDGIFLFIPNPDPSRRTRRSEVQGAGSD